MAMERVLRFSIPWIFIGFIVCPGTWAAVQPSEEFFGSVSLVNNDVYHLFWKSDDTSIIFEVHAKVKGWVGFGLSPNGGMAKSDIVIGWVKDGVPYFEDRYAEHQGIMPTIDASQDWTLLAAEETSTHTVLKFKRPLYSCDPEDRNVTANTMRVIFAYSDMDPSSEDAVVYHAGNRGTKSLLLISSQEKPPPMPADAFYKDFLNNNIIVPHNSDTTYWCQGFNAPNITEKHHLIKIEPIVQPGNEAFVHHIVLNACYHRPGGIEQVDESQGDICYGGLNMPWKECAVIITAWAVGGKAMGSVPEIYVFGVFLHTHLLGTGVRARHYRDGVEKPYLSSDLAYDFNYQETRSMAPEITIKKGDNIVVECLYNTADEKNATFGGLGTSQEMCLAYLYYYPTINLIYCLSAPTQANMAEHLSLKYEEGQGYSRVKISEGPYISKTLNQFIMAIGKFPDQATMDKYQEAVTTGDIVESCQRRSNTTRTLTQVPKVVSPYQEKAGQCSGALCHQPPGRMMLMMLCSGGLLLILATKLTTN